MKNHTWNISFRCFASPMLCVLAAVVLPAGVSGCQNSSPTVAMGDPVADVSGDPADRVEKIMPEQQKCVTKGEHGVRENFACYVIARRGGADSGLRIAYTADPEAMIPEVVETLKASLGGAAVEVRKVSADEYHSLQARLR